MDMEIVTPDGIILVQECVTCHLKYPQWSILSTMRCAGCQRAEAEAKLKETLIQIELLSKGIHDNTTYPEPLINGSAVETAIALLKDRQEKIRLIRGEQMKCAVCLEELDPKEEFPLLAHVEAHPDCGWTENERKLKVELRETRLSKGEAMTMSAGEGARILKHYGLEPWPDGRSICDGKRPVSQHIGMVISSLVADLKAKELQVGRLQNVVDALKDVHPDGCAQAGAMLKEQLDRALLQLRAMVEERDLYSDVVDAAETWLKHHGNGGISEAEANKALRYQVEQLGEKVAEKPVGVWTAEAVKKIEADAEKLHQELTRPCYCCSGGCHEHGCSCGTVKIAVKRNSVVVAHCNQECGSFNCRISTGGDCDCPCESCVIVRSSR